MKQPEVEDAVALGSAILSSLSAGVYDTIEIAVKSMVRTRRTCRLREKERRIYSFFHGKGYEKFEEGDKILA